MRTITVTVRATDLSAEMAAMREWLDSNRYEPSRFTYNHDGDAVVVSIDFAEGRQAEAFARRFDGREPRRPFPFR